MSSFHQNYSLHLDTDKPFEADVLALTECGSCALRVGQPGRTFMANLTLFFPIEKHAQVQRIADALNEMGKPVEVPKAEAA